MKTPTSLACHCDCTDCIDCRGECPQLNTCISELKSWWHPCQPLSDPHNYNAVANVQIIRAYHRKPFINRWSLRLRNTVSIDSPCFSQHQGSFPWPASHGLFDPNFNPKPRRRCLKRVRQTSCPLSLLYNKSKKSQSKELSE